MACALTQSYTLDCKDSIGGLKAVWFAAVEDIVGPYKAVMVDELELPYNSVVLTDRYLQDALAKQTNLADFRRTLRRDSRWQYTDKARQEVSSAALQVLRDFGFQG